MVCPFKTSNNNTKSTICYDTQTKSTICYNTQTNVEFNTEKKLESHKRLEIQIEKDYTTSMLIIIINSATYSN